MLQTFLLLNSSSGNLVHKPLERCQVEQNVFVQGETLVIIAFLFYSVNLDVTNIILFCTLVDKCYLVVLENSR